MGKLQNSNQVEICEDKELNGGVCPKGKDCTICNKKKTNHPLNCISL